MQDIFLFKVFLHCGVSTFSQVKDLSSFSTTCFQIVSYFKLATVTTCLAIILGNAQDDSAVDQICTQESYRDFVLLGDFDWAASLFLYYPVLYVMRAQALVFYLYVFYVKVYILLSAKHMKLKFVV